MFRECVISSTSSRICLQCVIWTPRHAPLRAVEEIFTLRLRHTYAITVKYIYDITIFIFQVRERLRPRRKMTHTHLPSLFSPSTGSSSTYLTLKLTTGGESFNLKFLPPESLSMVMERLQQTTKNSQLTTEFFFFTYLDDFQELPSHTQVNYILIYKISFYDRILGARFEINAFENVSQINPCV